MARTDPRPHYGTKRRRRDDGYVDLWLPGHPEARSDGYAFEHRVVLHDAGHDPSGLQVHHRNGRKDDNRIVNLQLVTIEEHTRLHWDERRPSSCPQGHAFTLANTWRSSQGWRQCRACNRERQRARKQAARAMRVPAS